LGGYSPGGETVCCVVIFSCFGLCGGFPSCDAQANPLFNLSSFTKCCSPASFATIRKWTFRFAVHHWSCSSAQCLGALNGQFQLVALQVPFETMLGHDPSYNSQPKFSMIPAGKQSNFCHTVMKQPEKFTLFSKFRTDRIITGAS